MSEASRPIATPKSTIQEQLDAALELRAEINHAAQSIEKARSLNDQRVRGLEEALRAASFAPNATMLRDIFYPFAMSARDEDIVYIARKGARVAAVRGQHDFMPVTITTAAGKQHEVDQEAVSIDAPTPVAAVATPPSHAMLQDRFPAGARVRCVKAPATRDGRALKIGDETQVSMVDKEHGLVLVGVPGYLMSVRVEPDCLEVIGLPPAAASES